MHFRFPYLLCSAIFYSKNKYIIHKWTIERQFDKFLSFIFKSIILKYAGYLQKIQLNYTKSVCSCKYVWFCIIYT